MEAASDVPCKGHGPHVCCGNKKEHSLKTSVEKSNASSQRVSQHAQVCLKLLCSQNESTRTRVESSERGDVLVFCTLPSQACAHHVDTRHVLTAAHCSRLTAKNNHTSVRSHCRCASHGTVLIGSQNMDGGGAWSQTMASGNVPCLPCSRGVVLVSSKHGRIARSVDGACGEEHRVDPETRDGGKRAQRHHPPASF